jgi:cyclophilin family peptidyl-prolyl cis-trans isomerase
MIWRATMILALAVAAFGCGGSGDGGETSGESEAAGAAPLPPDLGSIAMKPRIVMETTMGRIVLELDREKAPKTVDNFVQLVQNNFFDGLTFHRVVDDWIIQGGSLTAELAERRSSLPPIENEADNGLKNVRGTITMARTSDPHSATSAFFINLTDSAQLDHTAPTPQGWGYAVFGHVVEGMDVVDAISVVETKVIGPMPMDNVPVDPIVIERAFIEE